MSRLTTAVLLLAMCLSAGCQSSYYYNCHDNSEIDGQKASAISAASLEFTQAAFTGNVDVAYGLLSEAAKKVSSRDQVAGVFQALTPAAPFESVRVEKIMTVSGWGDRSGNTGIAICSKDASHPENGVTVAIQKVPEQAYALVTASSKANQETWSTALWLVPAGSKWQVNAFHTVIATAAGKRAADFLSLARSQKSRGHMFNAGLLYGDALSISVVAPFYHTGLEDLIRKESQEVVPPREFLGQPPFVFNGPSGPFYVVRLNTIPLKSGLYLVISHQTESWKDSGEIETRNEGLINTFAARFPEYSDVFAGLVAEATVRGGVNGWRTVRENASISSAVGKNVSERVPRSARDRKP